MKHLNPPSNSSSSMAALRQSNSSSGNVPFRWEHLPGISKAIHDRANESSSPPKPSLPPPPCSATTDSPGRLARHPIYVPLPPCMFVPMQELSSARKGMKKMDDHDDPFFAAFMACTKCSEKEEKKRKSVKKKVMDMRAFSCKYDVGVRENMVIRVHDGKKTTELKEE